MLENFFLTYANYPLKDNPENLRRIFEDILPYVDDTALEKKYLEHLIEYVIQFARFNEPKLADAYRKKRSEQDLTFEEIQDIGYEAVYGYRRGFCLRISKDLGENDGCFQYSRINYREVLRKAGLDTNERLKCYECYQFIYINYLAELALGKELKDMIPYWIVDEQLMRKPVIKSYHPNLKIGDKLRIVAGGSFEILYLNNAYDYISIYAYLSDDGKLKKSPVITARTLFPDITYASDSKYKFCYYLNSLVGYSLTEFLLAERNNLKRLRRCDECKKFCVSKTLHSYAHSFCSDKCRLAYHNRIYIQTGKAAEAKRKGRLEGKYQ